MAQKIVAATPPAPNTKWFVVLTLALIGTLIFAWPFLAIIAFSAVMAYLFIGPYRWLAQRMKKSLAATLAMTLSVAAVLIPITIVLILSIVQCVELINNISVLPSTPDSALAASTQPVVDTVNNALAGFNNGEDVVSSNSIYEFVKNTLPELMKAGLNIIIGIAGSIPVLMTSVIIYGFLVSAFLANNEAIRKTLKNLSPFDNKTSETYLNRAGNMIKGSLKGQLVLAVILGVCTALLMFILGLGDYFFFFIIIYTLLSMVPLGTGILVMPLAILAMVGGQFWAGLWVIILYLVVVCNIDNFLRPKLMPKNARIAPAILILSTFCGLFYFGLLGIVYGPVIAVILLTTLNAFLEYRGKPQLREI